MDGYGILKGKFQLQQQIKVYIEAYNTEWRVVELQ